MTVHKFQQRVALTADGKIGLNKGTRVLGGELMYKTWQAAIMIEVVIAAIIALVCYCDKAYIW